MEQLKFTYFVLCPHIVLDQARLKYKFYFILKKDFAVEPYGAEKLELFCKPQELQWWF